MTKEFKEKLHNIYESNSEVQRRKTWTKDQVTAAAIEKLSSNIHEFNKAKGGDPKYADAQKKAQEIAHQHLRNKGRQ